MGFTLAPPPIPGVLTGVCFLVLDFSQPWRSHTGLSKYVHDLSKIGPLEPGGLNLIHSNKDELEL